MIALGARDLGKKYEVYARPADRLREWATGRRRSFHRDVWALRNIYLEIPRGSTFGIIGPNGAGKSTLLKLVTGTTRPTEGHLEVHGSVAGILELGQGFNPDFSGRSNVLMNCSILGMTRAESEARFESIVDFAELWDVIDQPVRTYSTGMYLRLAFAVAVSVEPDILVVDEALAVGDEYFRGKCYDRINGFRKAGRTILFVSHSLGVVRNLCDQVVLLDGGRVAARGSADEVADAYLNLVHARSDRRLKALNRRSDEAGPPRWGSGAIEIREVRLLDQEGNERYSFAPGGEVVVEARYRARAAVGRPVFGIGIFRTDGTYICGVNHLWHPEPLDLGPARPGDTGTVRCTIAPFPLLQGSYYVSYYCYDHGPTVPVPLDHLEKVRIFQVTEGRVEMHGTVALPTRWEVQP